MEPGHPVQHPGLHLYRRHKQGKRLGHEITFYNVWYELRWGITSCAVLAISLISVIFYFHPTTSNVTSLFRTVTILSDMPGRVAEVYVQNNQDVRAGDPIFRLDTRRQEAAAETARRQINEIDVALVLVIILLVTAPILSVADLDIQLPTAHTRGAEDERRISVSLGPNGELAVDDELVATRVVIDDASHMALLDHPEVRQAVAFSVPDTALGEEVAAAVILSAATEIVRISNAGLHESHVHDVMVTKEAPNYRIEKN